MSKKKREDFLSSVENSNGDWLKKARSRKENRNWLRKSQKIAIRILGILDEKGIQQKELAKAMGVSPQQVSKIVKGRQNLTLETISKLEQVLGINLVEIPTRQLEMKLDYRKPVRANISKDKKRVYTGHQDFKSAFQGSWNTSKEKPALKLVG